MRPPHNQTSKPTDAPLFPFWIEDRGLSFFLAFLVLITIFVPMIPLSRAGRIRLDLIFAFMLFSGAIATIRHRALMYLVVALTILEFTADLIVEFNPLIGHLGWDTALKVSGMAISGGHDAAAHISPRPNQRAPGHGWSRRLLAHWADLGVRI
jgi:hypothetical protein